MRSITINLNKDNSIKLAVNALKDYQKWVTEKSDLLLKYLANIGVNEARLKFSSALYQGNKNITVSYNPIENGYSILAEGREVVFIEFGSGVTFGYGHPQNQMESGEDFSIGSWSTSPQGKGHWDNPKGWYYKDGAGYVHSYGNPPAMAMYDAEQKILMANLQSIAERVFR